VEGRVSSRDPSRRNFQDIWVLLRVRNAPSAKGLLGKVISSRHVGSSELMVVFAGIPLCWMDSSPCRFLLEITRSNLRFCRKRPQPSSNASKVKIGLFLWKELCDMIFVFGERQRNLNRDCSGVTARPSSVIDG